MTRLTPEERGCTFEGCDRRHKAHGWCEAHWDQLKKGKPLTPLLPKNSEKINGGPCAVDGCERKSVARGLCSTHYRRYLGGDASLPIRIKAYSEWDECRIPGCEKKPNIRGFCHSHGKKMIRFNLGPDKFLELMSKDKCDICSREIDAFTSHIDHDHTCCESTRKSCGNCIRGVLCSQCNMALGLFKDSITTLMAAVSYLEKG